MRIVALCALLAAACGSSPAAPAPNTTVPESPAPGIPATTVRFFGVVTTEEGAPVPSALVGVTYAPDSGPTQVAHTQTGSDGRYELQLSARQPGNINVLIRATASGDYLPNEQLVRMTDATERNIRLRRVRTIGIGQSTQVAFDMDSSRCMTPGTSGICESIRIRYPNTFVERLEVRANGDGAAVPTLVAEVHEGDQRLRFFFSRFIGQGRVTILADPEYWELYLSSIFNLEISIPDGAAPRQYEVTVQ
jgi:hypothetical protein